MAAVAQSAGTRVALPGQGRARTRHPWAAAIVAACLVGSVGIAIDLARRVSGRPPPLLVVAPVTRGLVVGHVEAQGRLEPARVMTLAQPQEGRLIEVRARAGDQVKKGDLLARFDPLALRAALARAEARLVAAEVASFEAEAQLHRLEHDLQADGPSTGELDEDDATLVQVAAARAARAAAQQAADEAAYKLARRRLAEGEVRAPADGLVLQRLVDEGQVLPAGSPLFTVAGLGGQLQVALTVAEAEAGNLLPGQEVAFTVPAFPGRKYQGRLVRLLPLVGAQSSRQMPLVVEPTDKYAELQPGMTVAARIRTASGSVTLRVPENALLFAPGSITTNRESPAIWLVDEPTGQLRQIPVEVRLHGGDYVEVSGNGLREGAAVAIGYAHQER